MKRYGLMVPFILLLCLSCADRSDRVTDSSAVVKIPDAVVEEDGIVTRFFDSENPYAVGEIAEGLANPVVSTAVSHFEACGYELREDYSFVVEGASADEEVEIRALAMAGTARDYSDAVHLVCLSTDDETVVVPIGMRRNTWNAVGSFDEPVGKLNFDVFDPFTEGVGAPGPDPIYWTWKRWGQCVLGSVAGGSTSCLISCSVIPVAYLKCLGVCAAAHTLGSLVRCTIREISENKNK